MPMLQVRALNLVVAYNEAHSTESHVSAVPRWLLPAAGCLLPGPDYWRVGVKLLVAQGLAHKRLAMQ